MTQQIRPDRCPPSPDAADPTGDVAALRRLLAIEADLTFQEGARSVAAAVRSELEDIERNERARLDIGGTEPARSVAIACREAIDAVRDLDAWRRAVDAGAPALCPDLASAYLRCRAARRAATLPTRPGAPPELWEAFKQLSAIDAGRTERVVPGQPRSALELWRTLPRRRLGDERLGDRGRRVLLAAAPELAGTEDRVLDAIVEIAELALRPPDWAPLLGREDADEYLLDLQRVFQLWEERHGKGTERRREGSPEPKRETVVLWEGAEPTAINVTIARTRSAYLEAHGNVNRALKRLEADGHRIGRSTFYEHLARLDELDSAWRRGLMTSGGTGIPGGSRITRRRGDSRGKRG